MIWHLAIWQLCSHLGFSKFLSFFFVSFSDDRKFESIEGKFKPQKSGHSRASAIFGHFIAICHCAELFHQSTAVYPIFGASQAKNNNTQWFV